LSSLDLELGDGRQRALGLVRLVDALAVPAAHEPGRDRPLEADDAQVVRHGLDERLGALPLVGLDDDAGVARQDQRLQVMDRAGDAGRRGLDGRCGGWLHTPAVRQGRSST